MLLSPRKNGLDSLFKEVWVFKELRKGLQRVAGKPKWVGESRPSRGCKTAKETGCK